jgi:diguanylate cyclase (GGDEF)-like protein
VRHLLTSRVALGAVLLTLLVGAEVTVRALQDDVARLVQRSPVATARIVADISVAQVTDEGLARTGTLTSAQRDDLTTAVRSLQVHEHVTGVEIWAWDGRKIYGDPGSDPRETRLPAAELTRSHLGRTWTTTKGAGSGREHNTFEVFVPHDVDGDDRFETIVEVLIPSDPITTKLSRYTRVLEGSALLLLLIAAAVLAGWRRRILERERRALVDRLTGLPNRAGLRRQIGRALPRAGPVPGRWGAVMLLNLDGFRAINETLGHPAGDVLLRLVARKLQAVVRPTDVVARLTADEFAVLMTDLPGPGTALARAQATLDHLQAGPYVIDEVDLVVEVSLGIALLHQDGDDPDVLLRSADIAMYRAKTDGGGIVVYDDESDARDVGHLATLAELRRAIEDDQLVLHYQPKARLASGDLAGVEALVRWQHPDRGLIGPDQFIPLAENTGLIHSLSTWVLTEAVSQVARWRDEGLMLPVAVNISPRSLLRPDFPIAVLRLLADQAVPADLLEIEITETSVMSHPERAIDTCRQLATTGVRLSIDDFGAGYTSLGYLRRLPVQTLKIDRGFITDILTDPADRAIAASVIELGQRLGLTVLAEGIESAGVWDLLVQLGCDEGQGYHLARPMPAPDLLSWIQHRESTGPGTPARY